LDFLFLFDIVDWLKWYNNNTHSLTHSLTVLSSYQLTTHATVTISP
jgi:hypothetical protein